MKKIRIKNNILEYDISSRYIIFLLTVFVLIGKLVRWTIMVDTLVNMSKGWGYVYPIIGGSKIPFELFTAENALGGEVGGINNMFLFYRLIWNLCLRIPKDFYSFEVAFTLIFTIILFILFTKVKKTLKMTEFIFICISTMVLSVYCFCLAKEPMQMIYFILLFVVLYTDKIPNNRKLLAGVIVILLMAATFRVYYVIFLVFAFPFMFFMRKFKDKEMSNYDLVKMLLKMGVVYLVMMTILMVVNGELYHRLADSLLYASDATSSSNTYIENVITQSKGNVLLVALEYLIAVIRLLFPIELIGLGPKYWPYIAYQIILSVLMIKSIKNYNKVNMVQRIATVLFVGFVFGSSTFEVDFGAWVRHGAVTLPLILLMTGMIKAKESEVVNEKETILSDN